MRAETLAVATTAYGRCEQKRLPGPTGRGQMRAETLSGANWTWSDACRNVCWQLQRGAFGPCNRFGPEKRGAFGPCSESGAWQRGAFGPCSESGAWQRGDFGPCSESGAWQRGDYGPWSEFGPGQRGAFGPCNRFGPEKRGAFGPCSESGAWQRGAFGPCSESLEGNSWQPEQAGRQSTVTVQDLPELFLRLAQFPPVALIPTTRLQLPAMGRDGTEKNPYSFRWSVCSSLTRPRFFCLRNRS